MADHSPLPWRVGTEANAIRSGVMDVLPEWTPISTPFPPFAYGATNAVCAKATDAQFIVRAVNSHADLLAALKAALAAIERGLPYVYSEEDYVAVAERTVRAAIAKAEGRD